MLVIILLLKQKTTLLYFNGRYRFRQFLFFQISTYISFIVTVLFLHIIL